MALYTVSFLHLNGAREVSSFAQTKRVALKRAAWLRSQSFVTRTFVHEGREGGNLIEEAGR